MQNTMLRAKIEPTSSSARLGRPFCSSCAWGLTSFGGPIAHLWLFSAEEFVERRKWLTEEAFVDLVALCQSLPGPTSSQVSYSIGMTRVGIPGAIAAFRGQKADNLFIRPSVTSRSKVPTQSRNQVLSFCDLLFEILLRDLLLFGILGAISHSAIWNRVLISGIQLFIPKFSIQRFP